MPEMPTLGTPARKLSPVAAMAAAALLAGAVGGAAYWFTHRGSASTPAEAPAPQAAAPATPPADGTLAAVAPTEGTPAPTPVGAPPSTLPAIAPAPGAAPTTVAAKEPVAPKDGLKGFTATINGPLEGAIIGQVGKTVGAPLTQVINRTLVWWMRVPQDLVKGDTLSAVYEEREGQEPVVHAVRFVSRKLGKTFEAYRFKSPGDDFARFYQADGSELEERLVDGPLDSWEQVTSLLRDGRKHKGVDFKTPVGTPVKAPFDGAITRRNWNFKGNGNCLEIEESGGQGRTAMLLHLSELPKTVKVGDHVKKGQALARSGNTGHSFAPHLHYQLMKGDRVIDPFESHKTTRSAIAESAHGQLDQQIARLRAIMPATTVAGG